MSWNKREIFLNEVAPLMHEILLTCTRNGIPMAASFVVGDKGKQKGEANPLISENYILSPDALGVTVSDDITPSFVRDICRLSRSNPEDNIITLGDGNEQVAFLD